MKNASTGSRRRLLQAASAALTATALLFAGSGMAAETDAAAALRAKYTSLRDALQRNEFKRPIVLESKQSSGELEGDVYALVEQPFDRVDAALKGVGQWCDILMLHLNVKYCRASTATMPSTLTINVGKKHDQPLPDTYRVQFNYKLAASTPDYLQLQLRADEGPLGTRDYRITLEAVSLDAKRSFLHLTYAYTYGFAARMAMQGYLATMGRDKVGFSIVGRDASGRPTYVDNVRGVVERNTMRYYLAIDTALDTYGLPPAERQEKRLRDWFAATERYPLQLHELDRDDYLEMKRKEVKRQREGTN